MNNTEIIILILAMALVTYVPRALPAVLVNKINFGEKTQKFLNLIPYTAMSALIFPGIFTIDKANPQIGIIGGIVAIALAWRKCSVMTCVVAAIASSFLLYTIL